MKQRNNRAREELLRRVKSCELQRFVVAAFDSQLPFRHRFYYTEIFPVSGNTHERSRDTTRPSRAGFADERRVSWEDGLENNRKWRRARKRPAAVSQRGRRAGLAAAARGRKILSATARS